MNIWRSLYKAAEDLAFSDECELNKKSRESGWLKTTKEWGVGVPSPLGLGSGKAAVSPPEIFLNFQVKMQGLCIIIANATCGQKLRDRGHA